MVLDFSVFFNTVGFLWFGGVLFLIWLSNSCILNAFRLLWFPSPLRTVTEGNSCRWAILLTICIIASYQSDFDLLFYVMFRHQTHTGWVQSLCQQECICPLGYPRWDCSLGMYNTPEPVDVLVWVRKVEWRSKGYKTLLRSPTCAYLGNQARPCCFWCSQRQNWPFGL